MFKANKIGRKRGKLNLEKTMAKNFFDTTTSNLFDAIIGLNETNKTSHNTNKIVHFESNNNSSNNSSRTNRNNNKVQKANSSDNEELSLVKDVKETSTIKTESQNHGMPSMYKIACRLRKVANPKQKKQHLQTVEEPKIIETLSAPVSSLVESSEMISNRLDNIDSLNNVNIASKAIKDECDDGFTERITEV